MPDALRFQRNVPATLLFVQPAEQHIHPMVMRFIWMWLW
jgi:hypothetical protein